MFNVCPQCGQYSARRTILGAEKDRQKFSVCPNCSARTAFISLPLYVITGPSGTGKSTVCRQLMYQRDDVVVFDSDVLWNETAALQDTLVYRDYVLRVAKNIAQAGRPVVLCGSCSPGEFEQCDEARYFAAIHYFALVAEADVLAARLKARPAWRDAGGRDFIQTHQQWAEWFKQHQHPHSVELHDTSHVTEDVTLNRVHHWLNQQQSDHR